MTDDRPSDLLGALPRSRPHRRSAKRPVREAQAPEAEAQQVTEAPPEPPKTARPRSTTRKSTAKTASGAPKATGRAAKPAAAPAKPAAKPRSAPAKRSQPAPARGIESAGKARARPSRQTKPLAQPAQPRGVPQGKGATRPEPTTDFPVLRTAVQAAAELTEIGVTLSAKAVRRALGRLPRP